jgi:hypothetical protein
MQLAVKIDSQEIFNAIKELPREEKILIAEKLEEQILAEWDSYESSPETIQRVNESFADYSNNDVIGLDEL